MPATLSQCALLSGHPGYVNVQQMLWGFFSSPLRLF